MTIGGTFADVKWISISSGIILNSDANQATTITINSRNRVVMNPIKQKFLDDNLPPEDPMNSPLLDFADQIVHEVLEFAFERGIDVAFVRPSVVVSRPVFIAMLAGLVSAKSKYQKVKDAALAEYEKVRGAALAEYEKVRDAALAEYRKVRGPALAEYEKVTGPALAEYRKATDAAWAEYEKVRDAAWAEYEKVEGPALADYDKYPVLQGFSRDSAKENILNLFATGNSIDSISRMQNLVSADDRLSVYVDKKLIHFGIDDDLQVWQARACFDNGSNPLLTIGITDDNFI